MGQSPTIGGGVDAIVLTNHQLTIGKSTISGNTASNGSGGGLHLTGGASSIVDMGNNTIAFNSSTQIGGGVFIFGAAPTYRVGLTIIASNSTSTGENPDCAAEPLFGATFTSSNGNIIGDSCGLALAGVVAPPCPGFTLGFGADDVGSIEPACGPGSQSQTANPGLGPLANNGGSTMTHLPAPGVLFFGHAQDRGGICSAGGTSDQRLLTMGDVCTNDCDAGAVEIQVPCTAACATYDPVLGTCVP